MVQRKTGSELLNGVVWRLRAEEEEISVAIFSKYYNNDKLLPSSGISLRCKPRLGTALGETNCSQYSNRLDKGCNLKVHTFGAMQKILLYSGKSAVRVKIGITFEAESR